MEVNCFLLKLSPSAIDINGIFATLIYLNRFGGGENENRRD
jgi:hypothetical protein